MTIGPPPEENEGEDAFTVDQQEMLADDGEGGPSDPITPATGVPPAD